MTAFSSSKWATVVPSLLCCSCLCNSSLYAAAFFLHVHKPQNVYLMLKISNCSTASCMTGPMSEHRSDCIPVKSSAIWKLRICAGAAR